MISTWRPRLIALDIDGTLQEAGGEIAPPVRAAVARAASAGAHIVLATGRCMEELGTVFEAMGLTRAYAICSNGAVIIQYPEMVPLRTVTFNAGDVLRLILRHVPTARVAVEEPGFGYGVTARFPDGELLGPQRVRPLDQMLAEPVTRVIVRDPDSSVEDFIDLVARIGIRGVSYAVGYKAWLDLGPEGVSKGAALEHLAASLRVARTECLAIGDGRNDIEMLTWAGRGVAMGQAPAEVKAVADAITDPVWSHGVALELERWFAA